MIYQKDKQFYKFCSYGFFKNLRFFDPFLLLFLVDKELTYSQIGTLYAFREIVVNLLEIVSGLVADVFGRKRIMIFAFIAYVISFVLFFFAGQFWHFIIAFFLFGIGDSFRTGTHKAMILAYLKRMTWEKDKTAYYGQTRSWSQKGAAISSLLGALLLFYTGDYSLMFLYSVLPYILGLFLLMSYPSYLNGDSNVSKSSIVPHVQRHFKDLLKALVRKRAIDIISLTSSFTGYYKASRDYLQIIIASLAVSIPFINGWTDEEQISVFIGVAYFTLYFITSYASKKSYLVEGVLGLPFKALGFVQILGYIAGLVAAIFYYFDYHLLALLFFVFIIIIQNIRRPISMSLIGSSFEEKMMASIMSVESQAETLFAAILALAIGLLTDAFGLPFAIGFISSVLLIISLLRSIFFKSTRAPK